MSVLKDYGQLDVHRGVGLRPLRDDGRDTLSYYDQRMRGLPRKKRVEPVVVLHYGFHE